MGQKVHPEILKLSRTAGWRSKYFEKKTIDFRAQQTKDLGVKKYIKQFFKKAGLKINTCNLGYLNSKLNIFASYTTYNELVDGIALYPRKYQKLRVETNKVSNFKKKKLNKSTKKVIRTNVKKLIFLVFFHINLLMTESSGGETVYDQTLRQHNGIIKLQRNFINSGLYTKVTPFALYSLDRYSSKTVPLSAPTFSELKHQTEPIRFELIKTIGIVGNLLLLGNLWGKKTYCGYKFMILFFKSLSFFFKGYPRFTLILKFLNKNLKKIKPITNKMELKKKLASLRKFHKNRFFKEGINLMFLMASQKEHSENLASYIASSIKNFKKHKLFIKFIKKGLYSFTKRKNSVVKSVKIQLKGRINGADRAVSYVMKAGERVSLLSLNSRINYSESTAFTPDGTLSVKVWVRYQKRRLTEFKSGRLNINKLCELRHKKQNIKKQEKVI